MKMVDLSHTMSVHTPGWVGYAGNKMYYAQNLQTVSASSRSGSTPRCMSAPTIDGALHATDGRDGDMASYPLEFLVNQGVDRRHLRQDRRLGRDHPGHDHLGTVTIEKGDILILHTG